MGCYRGFVGQSAEKFEQCNTPILFSGAQEYGPIEDRGRSTHAFWDFRYISSAEIYPLGEGENRRYYMHYEGIRGPGPFDAGDTQFGVGMARSVTNQLDGPWEKFGGNPILVDSPANIGIGHSRPHRYRWRNDSLHITRRRHPQPPAPCLARHTMKSGVQPSTRLSPLSFCPKPFRWLT